MAAAESASAFFAETRHDPYAHMILHVASQMWADGYEQALRDHGIDAEPKSFGERMNDAARIITDKNREEAAKTLIALAQIGRDLGVPRFPE